MISMVGKRRWRTRHAVVSTWLFVSAVFCVQLALAVDSRLRVSSTAASSDQDSLQRYAGAYGAESGPVLFVRLANRLSLDPPSTLLSSRLFLVREDGALCTLVHTGENTFIISPVSPSTSDRRIIFREGPDGRIAALHRREGLPDTVLPRLGLYREDEVTFEGPAGVLGGRLLLPSARGPAPAVVLLGGAGSADRNQDYFVVADVLARNGFAALVYDKRGTGSSSGDWRTAVPSDLADDALAALRFLRGRTDIDRDRIGFYGVSEGGLVGAIAASRDRRVAFLITVSAAGVPRSVGEPRWVENELRAAAFSQREITEALEFVGLEDRFVEKKAGWPQLEHASRAARAKRWFPYTWMGIFNVEAQEHWAWTWRRLHNQVDPARAFSDVRSPVLAIWGGLDTYAPELNRAAVGQALRRGGNRLYQLKVFPRADHLIREESNEDCGRRYATGYFDTLVQWTRRAVAEQPGR